MNKLTDWLKSWFSPVVDQSTKFEIDTMNAKNIYYVSLIVGIIQAISLAVYFFVHIPNLGNGGVIAAMIRVGLSVLLCLTGFLIAGRLLKSPGTVQNHPWAVRAFIGGFIVLLIIWAMYVSVNNYVNHQQLLTFYTVELIAALFVKLKPAFTIPVIMGSYIIHYLILEYGFIGGLINPYNYLMLASLTVIGAMLNYRLTARYITEKNKANLLNDSLEIIANYDSITRLQNRYALNQSIPDYVGTDICIAMGDINSFKGVNDTYGHRSGDEVLERFAQLLLDFFSHECVYRYGGDEFLVIQKDVSLDEFRQTLQKVSESFSTDIMAQKISGLGCSFGCVQTRPADAADFFEQLTQADKLLYAEKQRIKAQR